MEMNHTVSDVGSEFQMELVEHFIEAKINENVSLYPLELCEKCKGEM
jgi:hypothetical protein